MKKLPDGELELMMIIWEAGEPVSRIEIEEKMDTGKLLTAGTILNLVASKDRKHLFSINNLWQKYNGNSVDVLALLLFMRL